MDNGRMRGEKKRILEFHRGHVRTHRRRARVIRRGSSGFRAIEIISFIPDARKVGARNNGARKGGRASREIASIYLFARPFTAHCFYTNRARNFTVSWFREGLR